MQLIFIFKIKSLCPQLLPTLQKKTIVYRGWRTDKESSCLKGDSKLINIWKLVKFNIDYAIHNWKRYIRIFFFSTLQRFY